MPIDVRRGLNGPLLLAMLAAVCGCAAPAAAPGARQEIELPVAEGQVVLLRVAGAATTAQGDYALEFTNLDQFQTEQRQVLFFPARGNPTSVAVGDVSGDGRPDVVTASLDFANPVSVLQADAFGLLGAARGFDAGPGAENGGFRSVILDEFSGDRRLALAGWYQGARAVRERGLFEDTKEFVRIVLMLYGTV